MNDPLSQVKKYFQTQSCPLCGSPFEPEGVILEEEQDSLMVVKISCLACEQQVGIALVRFAELPWEEGPELTPAESEKFRRMGPITDNELSRARQFISHLDAGWRRHLPSRPLDPPREDD